jgi:hypothetical protein
MNWIARVVIGLIGLVVMSGLLAALGVYIVYASLRWLLTGRKPQVVWVWQQFNQIRRGARWRHFESPHQPDPDLRRQHDIVDVEVREVHEVRDGAPRLPARSQD